MGWSITPTSASITSSGQVTIPANTSTSQTTYNVTYTDTNCECHFTITQEGKPTGLTAVDLGLPSGTKWANMNVGATSETDYGNYYQYGKGARTYQETSGETDYDGIENPLSFSVDTARQVLHGFWHMPTKTQFEELITSTTYSIVSINGVQGAKFTASNGNYIFFPWAGYWSYGSQTDVGGGGYVWTSTPGSDSRHAYWWTSDSRLNRVSDYYRQFAYNVRGVIG